MTRWDQDKIGSEKPSMKKRFSFSGLLPVQRRNFPKIMQNEMPFAEEGTGSFLRHIWEMEG